MNKKLGFPSCDPKSSKSINEVIKNNERLHNSIVRDACIDKFPNVDRKKLDKAIEDTCSWMIDNYGHIDWDQYQAEIGDVVANVLNYCEGL